MIHNEASFNNTDILKNFFSLPNGLLKIINPLFKFYHEHGAEKIADTSSEILKTHNKNMMALSSILSYGLEKYFNVALPIVENLLMTPPLYKINVPERVVAQSAILTVLTKDSLLAENKNTLILRLHYCYESDIRIHTKIATGLLAIRNARATGRNANEISTMEKITQLICKPPTNYSTASLDTLIQNAFLPQKHTQVFRDTNSSNC